MNETGETGPVRVFISYARKDHACARRIYNELKARGFKPWMDKVDLLPGMTWKDEIKRSIEGSDYFLALLSPHALTERGYVQKELKFGLEVLDTFPRGKIYFVPARLAECYPEDDQLKNLHWADLFPDSAFDDGIELIVKSLSLGLDRQPTPPRKEEPDEELPAEPWPPETDPAPPGPHSQNSPTPEEETPSERSSRPPEENRQGPADRPADKSKITPPEKKNTSSDVWEKIAVFAFGVLFIGILLWIAFQVPDPTDFQLFLFRVVLSLAAAGVGALLPGLLDVRLKSGPMAMIRAGGAVGLFVLVYLVNPPALIDPVQKQRPGRVEVSVEPEDANVSIFDSSGNKVSYRKGGVELEAGEYRVSVDREGHETQTRSISLQSGKTAELNFILSRIPVPDRKVALIVRSNVDGDEVFIDEKSYGPSGPEEIMVPPGERRVRVEKAGFSTFEKTVNPEKTKTVWATLEPAASLVIWTDPAGATVFVDGKRIGPSPQRLSDLTPGRTIVIRAEKKGYEDAEKTVEVPAKDEGTVELSMAIIVIPMGPNPGQLADGPLPGMKFAYIPPGEFMMGSPKDEPGRDDDETLHKVILTEGFWLQTTETTQGQWKAVMGNNPSRFGNCDNCPVEQVSWEDVQEFLKKLNARGDGEYRLPTEAQWEYAARAGTTTPFYFGDCLSTDQANYNGNYPLTGCPKGRYREKTVPAGSLNAPNAWNLQDMHGNVWEWCMDWHGDYPSGSVTDPTGPATGANRVNRGGSWDLSARYCRAASRFRYTPSFRFGYLGFRVLADRRPAQAR